MPSPVYILCSEGGTFESETFKASVYNIVQQLVITKIAVQESQPPSQQIPPMPSLRITAAWMRDEKEDQNQAFEAQFILRIPNAPPELQELAIAFAEIKFEKPLAHVAINGLQLQQFFGPGILRVEGRLRPVGSQEWLAVQSYPIILSEAPATTPVVIG